MFNLDLCNSANYGSYSNWNGINGNLTTVGSNGKSSYYGSYDHNGNINELVDSFDNGYPIFRG